MVYNVVVKVAHQSWSLLVAQIKLDPESSVSHEPSSSQGPTLIFFLLLLMSSGCYSLLYKN